MHQAVYLREVTILQSQLSLMTTRRLISHLNGHSILRRIGKHASLLASKERGFQVGHVKAWQVLGDIWNLGNTSAWTWHLFIGNRETKSEGLVHERRRDDDEIMTRWLRRMLVMILSFLVLQEVIRQATPICNLLLPTLLRLVLVNIVFRSRSKDIEKPLACIADF